jgi:putative oxidoreductase
MDTGLLLLRILLAAVLLVHGSQKLFGTFGGPGFRGAVLMFEALGHRPAHIMVLIAGSTELVGAALLAAGAVTPLAAATVVGVMLVAGASTTRARGTLWSAGGGGEYPLVLAGTAAVLAFTGPGAWSLDAVLDAPWIYGEDGMPVLVGVAAVVVAAGAAAIPSARARPAAGGPR